LRFSNNHFFFFFFFLIKLNFLSSVIYKELCTKFSKLFYRNFRQKLSVHENFNHTIFNEQLYKHSVKIAYRYIYYLWSTMEIKIRFCQKPVFHNFSSDFRNTTFESFVKWPPSKYWLDIISYKKIFYVCDNRSNPRRNRQHTKHTHTITNIINQYILRLA
jgi:hypothetical protein